MDDVRHVAAIKEAVGDSASVRVDVNQAWDEATAAKGMAELQAAGIDLVEQPTPMKDYAALVRLSEKFHLPILADEAVADAKDMFSLAAAGFSGAVAMKIAKAGGPMKALDQAKVAQAAGIGLYGGTLLEGTIGTAASLHAWSTLETLHWEVRDVRPAADERRHRGQAAELPQQRRRPAEGPAWLWKLMKTS